MSISSEFDLVLKALNFAKLKHQGQTRKKSGLDYFLHPLAVSYVFSRYKESKNIEKLICACILHDTLEDTDTTVDELKDNFGYEIASIVAEVTNDEEKMMKMGKIDYLTSKMLHMSSYGLCVKLCDMLCNLMDAASEKQSETYKTIAINILMHREHLSQSQINMLHGIISHEAKNEGN